MYIQFHKVHKFVVRGFLLDHKTKLQETKPLQHVGVYVGADVMHPMEKLERTSPHKLRGA